MSKGKPLEHCRACGSVIVETINDSLFRDGECNGCEYARYKSQPGLLEACRETLAHTVTTDAVPPEIDDLMRSAIAAYSES